MAFDANPLRFKEGILSPSYEALMSLLIGGMEEVKSRYYTLAFKLILNKSHPG